MKLTCLALQTTVTDLLKGTRPHKCTNHCRPPSFDRLEDPGRPVLRQADKHFPSTLGWPVKVFITFLVICTCIWTFHHYHIEPRKIRRLILVYRLPWSRSPTCYAAQSPTSHHFISINLPTLRLFTTIINPSCHDAKAARNFNKSWGLGNQPHTNKASSVRLFLVPNHRRTEPPRICEHTDLRNAAT